MGAVAIMKAMKDYGLKPDGIILECPFGSMSETVEARFKSMNVPTFPMAGLLVFWGGIQNGFWAFGHNPAEYAKHISCPTLLLFGEKDKNVTRGEIDQIFQNLVGEKKLATYQLAGHDNYLTKYKAEWTKDVSEFLRIKQMSFFFSYCHIPVYQAQPISPMSTNSSVTTMRCKYFMLL